MSQRTYDLWMVYYQKPDGTLVLIKPKGNVLAFSESITAQRFVSALQSWNGTEAKFISRHESVMVDSRFPIQIVQLAEKTDSELKDIAYEVVGTMVQPVHGTSNIYTASL